MNQLLAISENYMITHSHETVYLTSQNKSILANEIEIGDFYGNPEIAIIDENEKWCVSAGCGFIVYYLNEPFSSYSYNKINQQYDEYYRNPPDIWWIIDIKQISPTKILLIKEYGEQYIFDIQTKKFTFTQ